MSCQFGNCTGVEQRGYFALSDGRILPITQEQVKDYCEVLNVSVCSKCGSILEGVASQEFIRQYTSPPFLTPLFAKKELEARPVSGTDRAFA